MSQENVNVARRFYKAFNERDSEAFPALLTSDFEWWPALIGGGILEGAVYRGHQGMMDFLEVQDETWETVTATPVALRPIGQARVIVEVHLVAVGRMSGASVERNTWNVVEVRDGKVAYGRVNLTQAEALEAAGLSE